MLSQNTLYDRNQQEIFQTLKLAKTETKLLLACVADGVGESWMSGRLRERPVEYLTLAKYATNSQNDFAMSV